MYKKPVTWELSMHTQLSKGIVLERTTCKTFDSLHGSDVSTSRIVQISIYG